MAEKPFGWRPFTDEYRNQLRKMGLSDEQIAANEASNEYRPDEAAIIAMESVFALLDVVARKQGASVIRDFRHVLAKRANKMASSDAVEDRVEARILQRFVDDRVDWDAITDRASRPDGDDWEPAG